MGMMKSRMAMMIDDYGDDDDENEDDDDDDGDEDVSCGDDEK